MPALLREAALPAAPPRSRRPAAQFLHSLDIWIPAAFLAALIFCCFVLPLLVHLPPSVSGNIIASNLPIGSRGHMLGTDELGNDIFARLLYGGRVSLEVGASTQVIGLVIGGLLGIVAGYEGGAADAVLMRVFDMFIAFPSLVLVLALVDGLGPSEMHLIWALSVFSVPAFGRLARAATLQIRDRDFMVAARLTGEPRRRIIFAHIVPNIVPQLCTFALLGAGIAILLEGALSYLGYGIPRPGASWGNMIATGQALLSAQPRLVVVPSLFLLVTVIAFNVLGDALRSRWNVR